MFEVAKTACFSGHRSKRLSQTVEDMGKLQISIYEEIDQAVIEGYDTFIFGACYGFDLLCAEMVLLRKKVMRKEDPEQIRLIAAVPFPEQAMKWSQQEQRRYHEILEQCDEVIHICEKHSLNCYRKRNRYMVDNSSRLICYYDGKSSGTASTVRYAFKKEVLL